MSCAESRVDPLMCLSTDRPSAANPEAWFQAAHTAEDGHHHARGAAHREQAVEIASGPGPKGAFEKDNVGAVTQRVAPGVYVPTSGS